jgi:hypothetical protein
MILARTRAALRALLGRMLGEIEDLPENLRAAIEQVLRS